MAKSETRVVMAGAPMGDGKLVIAPEVLEEIAQTEVAQTPGVVPALEGVMLGLLRRGSPYGLRLETSGSDVVLYLTFGVRSGVCIPDVATAVRQRIASAVHAKTGYRVRAVHILVDHVDFDARPAACP